MRTDMKSLAAAAMVVGVVAVPVAHAQSGATHTPN